MFVCGGLYGQTNAAVPDAPTFDVNAPVVMVPYSGEVDFGDLRSLHVRLTLNGGEPHGFDVDTGSVGIMVAASEIPGFDGKGEPGEITYTSSGVHLAGVWTTVDVGFPDARSADGKPVVAHMQVLAVTGKECTGKGVNAAYCKPGPAHPYMLGIGFGRGLAKNFDAQRRNAFVMLNAMQAGAMRRGYMITPKGIQLGLNQQTAQGDWVWQRLARRAVKTPNSYAGPPDYETAPGTFEVKGHRLPMGTVLMDTGLTNMMVEAPGAPSVGDLPEGTKVRIDLLGGRLSYEFRVNETSPVSPRRVSWRFAQRGTFVNTGLRALALFDYCYDAEDGYLGLRPRK